MIRTVTSQEIESGLADFVELLRDAVASDASIGYFPPLDPDVAVQFWRSAAADVAAGTRIVLAAYVEGELAGSVQLALALRPNSRHRAEVQKLLVHTAHRGQGLARRLMSALEAEALASGRTLLVLDTKKGDLAEQLYEKLGFIRCGEIPAFVTNSAGGFDTTVVFYKHLQ
ncbi:MAG TPA: GNAT family N-acetyltransferase [Thermoanaerobaculia bacterium]|nr:GNAT family N-acetyltransferase [Thermoanaerobaculia bacterium]